MSWPPGYSGRAVLARMGVTAAGGGAGSVVTLLAVRKPSVGLVLAACFAAGVVASAAARIVESVWSRRAGVIAAKGKAKADRISATASKEALLIKANSEAAALGKRTSAYTTVSEAGLDVNRVMQAAEMLAYLTVNPDLPEGKRPADDTIKEILADLRRGKGSPSRSPRSRSSDVVVTMPRRRRLSGATPEPGTRI